MKQTHNYSSKKNCQKLYTVQKIENYIRICNKKKLKSCIFTLKYPIWTSVVYIFKIGQYYTLYLCIIIYIYRIFFSLQLIWLNQSHITCGNWEEGLPGAGWLYLCVCKHAMHTSVSSNPYTQLYCHSLVWICFDRTSCVLPTCPMSYLVLCLLCALVIQVF